METTIGSNNSISSGWRQDIVWTSARIWLIRTSVTNFSEILSETHKFSVFENVMKLAAIYLFLNMLNPLNTLNFYIENSPVLVHFVHIRTGLSNNKYSL